MSSSDNTGAFLTGFLFGALAGAAAALLMTPQSGDTTRSELQQRGFELKSRFDDLSAGIQERGRLIIEDKRPAVETTGSDEASEAPTDAGSDASAETTTT